jgi:hypothetical protein
MVPTRICQMASFPTPLVHLVNKKISQLGVLILVAEKAKRTKFLKNSSKK